MKQETNSTRKRATLCSRNSSQSSGRSGCPKVVLPPIPKFPISLVAHAPFGYPDPRLLSVMNEAHEKLDEPGKSQPTMMELVEAARKRNMELGLSPSCRQQNKEHGPRF